MLILSLENEFLLTSISGFYTSKSTDALTQLSQEVDWTLLIESAYQHGISGILCDFLINVCFELVPEEILIAAEEHQKIIRKRNRQFSDQIILVVSKLSEHHIETIPFKGVVLCQKIYGDLALRSFSDLDFLIRKKDRKTTLVILKEIGYSHDQGLTAMQQEAYYDYGGQDILFGDSVPLEPHWEFSPKTFSLMIDYEAIWQRSNFGYFAGKRIAEFNVEDELIILCIHGSKEKWTKLKWIADLAVFIARNQKLDWEIILNRAVDQGVERMVLLGLQLCRELLTIDLPEYIQVRLDSDPTLPSLVCTVKGNLFNNSSANKSIYCLSLYHWRLRERWQDRFRYVLLTIVTPRTTHFKTVTFPNALFYLYYPYKILHDYVLIPVWKFIK